MFYVWRWRWWRWAAPSRVAVTWAAAARAAVARAVMSRAAVARVEVRTAVSDEGGRDESGGGNGGGDVGGGKACTLGPMLAGRRCLKEAVADEWLSRASSSLGDRTHARAQPRRPPPVAESSLTPHLPRQGLSLRWVCPPSPFWTRGRARQLQKGTSLRLMRRAHAGTGTARATADEV
eukprot:1761400-Prymnesium_polylepis.1